jgi:glycosyltransferase involved in cell wall biosynthesis
MEFRNTRLAPPRGDFSTGQAPIGSPGRSLHRGRSILFVVGTLDLGGSESQLVLLAEELARRGWNVQVFSLARRGVLADRLAEAGVPVFYGSFRPAPDRPITGSVDGGGKPPKPPTRRPSIRALMVLARSEAALVARIVRSRPAVVHGLLPLTNLLGAVAGRVGLAPLVITSRRGLGNHQDRWPRFKTMDRIANRLSHVVVANSRAVATDTARRDGYDVGRIQVIPNGINLSRFADLERQRETSRGRFGLARREIGIVSVANLIPYKGHADLIQAFALAREERPELRLFLVGQDRGIHQALVEEARRLNVAESVRLLGQQTDIPGILAGMDVGVIASHEEGFSNALLEKLAAGLPVVATDVGGNPEALDGMRGCALAQPKQPRDLARALLDVVRRLPEPDAERRARRELIRKRYSVEAMVSSYEQLYLVRPSAVQ